MLSDDVYRVYIVRKMWLKNKYGFAKEYRGNNKIVLFVGTSKIHIFEDGQWHTAFINTNDLQNEIDFYRY